MRRKPTPAELELLAVLWRRGPSTVRDIHAESPGSGYTTVLKLLQIMTDKGLVTRDESERAHVYKAAIPREETQSDLVGDLLDRVFSGSAAELVLRALSDRPASKTEIRQIREMLDQIEQQGDKS